MTEETHSHYTPSKTPRGMNNHSIPPTPTRPLTRPIPREPSLYNSHNDKNRVTEDDDKDFYPEVIDIPQNTWLFDLHDIFQNSPSRVQGIDLKHEMILRLKGAFFIQRLFFELRVSHRTLYYAWTYYQRFLTRASLKVFGQYEALALSLFLACKTTENHRGYNDLIPLVVKDTTKGKITECKETSKEFWKWRDTIETYECHLIELLCFDLVIELPYDYTQSFARSAVVGELCRDDRKKLDHIMSTVTSFIEDSLLIGNSLVNTVKVLFHTGVIYTAFALNLPQLLKDLDINVDECYSCLNSFFEILKQFPVEQTKKFEKYRVIERDQFMALCQGD